MFTIAMESCNAMYIFVKFYKIYANLEKQH